jgi:hypothetical protein
MTLMGRAALAEKITNVHTIQWENLQQITNATNTYVDGNIWI